MRSTVLQTVLRAIPASLAAVVLLFAPGNAAAALSGDAAVSVLNAQRVANGIPPVAHEPALTDGCVKHNRYMRLNGEMTHTEVPGRPGYTPEGARETTPGAAEVLAGGPAAWDSAWRSPWDVAPIHQLIMYAPDADRVGYADTDGYQCLRTLSGTERAPGVYSFPGPGAVGVPPQITANEWPYTPAQAVGLPARTGFNILVWRVGGPLEVASATLTGPAGPLDIRVLDPRTPTPDGGTYRWGGATIVPVRPLAPFGSHTLEIVFVDGAVHRTAFTTGAAPALPQPQQDPGDSGGTTQGGRAPRRIQRLRLRARGRWITVSAGRPVGRPRTGRLQFFTARRRLIATRRVRLAGTRRVRMPRGTRRIELRASRSARYWETYLLLPV